MSIGVPIKVLHEAEGHIVTCETNTGEVYRGKLIEAEDNMNCQVSSREVRLCNYLQFHSWMQLGGFHKCFSVPRHMMKAKISKGKCGFPHILAVDVSSLPLVL